MLKESVKLLDSQKQAVIKYVQIDRLLPYTLDVCNEAFQGRDRIARLPVLTLDRDIQHTKP